MLREVMLGETVGMTMHFRDDLETSALETLSYMKVILMGCSNNGKDRIPAGHFLLPNEASSTKMSLHSMQLLAKGANKCLP